MTRDAKTITTCFGDTLMRLLRHLLLSTAMLFLLGQATFAREWTDASGKFKVEAELVKVEGGNVFLKKQADGATIQVPVNRLSAADQAHLQSLQSPAAELAATGSQSAFRLGTAGCVGLLVVDPKPLLLHETLGQQPLKGLVDKVVDQAGIDFRKVDRVTAFLHMPDLQNAMQGNETNAVAVAEFSEPVDPASMLSKIPTTYEAVTVAGKSCQKPAENGKGPWVCVLDEKTLAFAYDEEALTKSLEATGDAPELAALLAAADPENEVRFVLNVAPMQGLVTQLKGMVPPEGAESAGPMIDVAQKVDSVTVTTDLDGTPSIEVLLRPVKETSAADLETAIKAALAQSIKDFQKGMETGMAIAAEQKNASAMPLNPAMMAQMMGGMAEKIDESLNFEPVEDTLKISVKFPPDSPPLTQTIMQIGSFVAMMSQAGPGGPFGAPPK